MRRPDMKKLLIFALVFAAFFSSCKTMKRQKDSAVAENKIEERKTVEAEAKESYFSGKYQDSVTMLKALLEKDPKNGSYWNRLGSAYAQMQELDYAIFSFIQAVKLDKTNVKAMYNLSVVYSEKGYDEKAFDIARKALSVDPGNPYLQALLGNVLINEENLDKAKNVYERIVADKPEFEEAHYNLGVINYAQKNLGAAEKNYQYVLNLKPDDNEAKENLSAIYIMQNDYEKAISYLKQVIGSNPGDDIVLENAYFNLGIAYLKTSKYREALDSFEMAIKIEPWDMAAYVDAAIAAEQLGEKDKAVKYWTKYDRLLPVHKRKEEMKRHLEKMGVKLEPAPTEETEALSGNTTSAVVKHVKD